MRMSILRKILKQIYYKQKGADLQLSDKISDSFLVKYYINKIFSLLRGIIFYRRKWYVERKSRIDCHNCIRAGKNLSIGRNAYLFGLSNNGLLFGDNVAIGCNTRIEGSGSLSFLGEGFVCGNNCGLGTDCFYGCAGGIKLGNDVIVGNFVSFHSENHNYMDKNVPIRLQGVNHKGITVGNNCWIGAKSTILDGANIGNNCVIAAGAVVTGNFPDNVVIGGVPAKIIKNI